MSQGVVDGRLGERAATWIKAAPARFMLWLYGGAEIKPITTDKLWKAMAMVLPLSAGIYAIIPRYVIVLNDSIDAHAITAAPGVIRKNDLVSFELSHPLAGPKPRNVSKYALCLPGERLTSRRAPTPLDPSQFDTSWYCGGVYLNTTKNYTKNGDKLDPFVWKDGPVPAGYLFVGSHHVDGFDSRYFGLVPLSSMTRMRKVF